MQKIIKNFEKRVPKTPLKSPYDEEAQNKILTPLGKEVAMKHNLTINVSKEPKNEGVVACRTITLRERVLRKLLGNPCKVTILVPGDTVEEVAIKEVVGGESCEAV